MTKEHAIALDGALARALLERLLAAPDAASKQADLEKLRHFAARGTPQPLRSALEHLIDASKPNSPEHHTLKTELYSLPLAPGGMGNGKPVALIVSIPKPLPKPASFDIDVLDEMAWPFPPLFEADWKPVEGKAMLDAATLAQACFPEVITEQLFRLQAVRTADLMCYPGYRVVELLFLTKSDEVVAQIGVYGAETALLVSGISPGIHEFNAIGESGAEKRLQILKEKEAKAYLQFFCGCVHGDEGPFRIIETTEQLGARWTETEVPESIKEMVVPFSINEVDANPADPDSKADTTPASNPTWKATATVCYSNALFTAQFQIQGNGMVTMLDDEPQATDLPMMRDGFIHNLRIASKINALTS